MSRSLALQEDPAPSEPPEELELSEGAPTSIGRYRVCYEIGRGGMATLYLGRAEGPDGFGKLVTLKQIHPHLARERKFVEMFVDEARLASQIHHPNVCSVIDFGEANSTYYLAMEFLAGESLDRVLRAAARRRRRAAADTIRPDALPHHALAARVIADACEGLHAAHELRDPSGALLNLVHRDISPSNLFLTYDGAVKIVDFGIASAASRVHHTRTGAVKGKFAYMAPEQMYGKEIDRRADVWSLGVVLHELLTLKKLFARGSSPAIMRAVLDEKIPAPSEIRKDIPQELDAVVMRCLARERSDRYATARDFGRDLMRFLATTGSVMGLAEVSEWIHELKPHGRKHKQRMIQKAMQGVFEAPSELTIDVPEESSLTGEEDFDTLDDTQTSTGAMELRARESDGPKQEPYKGAERHDALSEMPTAPPPPNEAEDDDAALAAALASPTNGRLPWFLAAGALVLVGAGWFLLGSAEEAPPKPVVAAPKPTPPKPAPPKLVLPPEPKPEPKPAVPPSEPELVEPAKAKKTPGMRPGRRRGRGTATVKSEPKRVEQTKPPPAANGPKGTLNVATPGGWAEVSWRGRVMGRSPTRLTLPSGPQVIRLRPFGGVETKTVTVEVKPNEVVRVKVRIGG